MGKSTTAAMFAAAGCAVWDADAAVHRLYAKGGAAVAPMAAAFPLAIRDDSVSRDALRTIIQADRTALPRIESIVHPLVRDDRAAFAAETKADIAVFDIPLLFETGSEGEFDAVACVFVGPDEQRSRVMARGTMSEAQFEQILAKQMPIEDKCARSDYIIPTDTLEGAQAAVQDVLSQIKGRV
ncbi:Dephospho-CoA kinase [Pseudoprimorskyibacter insulae]|uniref:Dephospho-CoA kinase n=2 Tax=Pseudoprimorskyibacter insulae TaxID=1695997 RepID=A0A2R8ATP9_9RHOB|nr:Dephospho-CoA kinase [Pseudoprimorskyibacter insulae]